jgi:hypothetical protein
MVTGSSAMPQIGQEPGPFCRISGCIGQVYSASGSTDAVDLACPPPPTNSSGFALNRSMQLSLQK